MPIDYQLLEKNCLENKVNDIAQQFLQQGHAPINQAEVNRIRDLITAQPETAESKLILALLNGKIPLLSVTDAADRKKLYAYFPHVSHSIRGLEDRMQREVNERFWRVKKPLRPASHSLALYDEIKTKLAEQPRPAVVDTDAHAEADIAVAQALAPIELNGKSSRALILALLKIISEKEYFPSLKFKIAETIILCQVAKPDARSTQKANFWVMVEQLPDEHFTYGSWSNKNGEAVASYLSKLCVNQPLREQQLAKLLKDKMRLISVFTEADFNEYGYLKLEAENQFDISKFRQSERVQKQAAINKAIHYLNGLNFLRVVCEATRRLYRTAAPAGAVHNYHDGKARQSDAMPIALLQARSLELLAQGRVRLKDVFGESDEYGATQWNKTRTKSYVSGGKGLHRAKYGVVTGVSTIANIDITEAKAVAVNAKTETDIIRPSIAGFFSSVIAGIPAPTHFVKEGHNKQRHLLSAHYGGDSDSEGADYSEDEVVAQVAGLVIA